MIPILSNNKALERDKLIITTSEVETRTFLNMAIFWSDLFSVSHLTIYQIISLVNLANTKLVNVG